MFSSNISRTIALTVGVLAMVLLISYVAMAVWTEPGTTPPGGNVPAPLNIGSTDQTKTGGIGTKFLSVSSADNDKIKFYGTQTAPHTIWLGDGKGVRFWDSINGELMRITNTGDVGIGVTGAPGYELEVVGDVGADAFYYRSDESLKENIKPLDNALEKIIALRGVGFNFKGDETKEKTIGLIAQEVEKILPEIVSKSEESGLKSVDYAKIVPVLIEAIREQQKEIENLRYQIDFLMGK